MSKLEDLLAELCPDGVEYKVLREVGTMIRGNGLQKKDFCSTGVGCIHYGQIYTHYKNFAYKTKSFVSQEVAEKLKKVNTGNLVIAITSENVEDVCKSVAWLGDEEIVTGGHCAIFKHKQNPKYLAYCFQTEDFFAQKRKIANGTKVIEVSPRKLEELKIPVPPLPVQNEIVRILDNFTELTAELKTQLAARKKQYEYYRDSLLTFEDEVEWKTLGTICDINTGSKPPKIHKELNIYQYINAGTTNSGFTENYNSDGGVVTTPSRGQGGIGFVGYQKNRFWLGPLCYRIQTVNEKHVLAKYVYYYLQNNKELILKIKNEGGVPSVNKVDLEKISVKIPPFVEQQRIVAILDRFDTLCSDISTGLPAEIAARTKQYEYYRDKLLTFPERA